jgi:methyl-accepting chemotaxis protein
MRALSPAPSPLSPSASTAQDYIRSNAVWRPAVQAFRNLRFRPKAWIVAAAFMVPIGLLGYHYYTARVEALKSTADEREGIAYARVVLPAIKHARQWRRFTMDAAAASAPLPEVAALRQKLDADIAAVKDMDSRLGERFGTHDTVAAIDKALSGAQSPMAGMNKVFASHSTLNAALLAVLDKVADGSGLTLDPELDTYYLMDASLVTIPNLLEQTARMRVLAKATARTGQNAAIAAIELAREDGLSEYLEAVLRTDQAKVASVHTTLTDALDPAAVIKQIDGLRDTASDDPAGGGEERAKSIDAAGAAIVERLEALQFRDVDLLDAQLAARMATVRGAMVLTATVVAACVLLAGYLFYAFSLVMGYGLREVRRHLKAITEGDLTSNPKGHGRDEAAFLLDMMGAMQGSLRTIVGEVRFGADHVVTASSEIESMSRDLAQRTEMTAGNVERSASSMEQISSTVKTTADNAIQATTLATSNASAAERGGVVIHEMIDTMDGIRTSSSRISDIIGTIDGIAFQTNILALNAAVEAARAGESGRGFAVVASEVRALAQRSAGAAREIKTLITESVEKVEAGTVIVRNAGQMMEEIVGSSREVERLLGQIANGAREQTIGVDQVGLGMNELDQATQDNTALVEETAAAALALREQATSLLNEVARFKVGT